METCVVLSDERTPRPFSAVFEDSLPPIVFSAFFVAKPVTFNFFHPKGDLLYEEHI